MRYYSNRYSMHSGREEELSPLERDVFEAQRKLSLKRAQLNGEWLLNRMKYMSYLFCEAEEGLTAMNYGHAFTLSLICDRLRVNLTNPVEYTSIELYDNGFLKITTEDDVIKCNILNWEQFMEHDVIVSTNAFY